MGRGSPVGKDMTLAEARKQLKDLNEYRKWWYGGLDSVSVDNQYRLSTTGIPRNGPGWIGDKIKKTEAYIDKLVAAGAGPDDGTLDIVTVRNDEYEVTIKKL